MAWLYIPDLTESPCAVDMEESNWELSESFQNTAPFVMWRGKPMQLRKLSKEWKKAGWIRHLSGLMLKPSTAQSGVEKWISSLEDSPANPIQMLESKWGKKMKEIYGMTSLESLAKCDLDSYSLKMFQVSLNGDLVKYSSTLPNWGIMLHGVLSQLPKWVPHIEESDGSFLESNMPTPTVGHIRNHSEPPENYFKRVQDWKAGKTKGKPGMSLGVYAQLMPTPTAREPNEVGGSMERHKRKGREKETLTRLISGEENLTHGGKLNPEWVAWLMGLPIGWIN